MWRTHGENDTQNPNYSVHFIDFRHQLVLYVNSVKSIGASLTDSGEMKMVLP